MLVSENEHIENFRKLLNEQWKIKRGITDQITNDRIDEIYEAGINGGAIGGKLLGAGSGGFMLFFTPPEAQEKMRKQLGSKLLFPSGLISLVPRLFTFLTKNTSDNG